MRVNRTQALVLGFCVVAWLGLIAVVAAAPAVLAGTLPGGHRTAAVRHRPGHAVWLSPQRRLGAFPPSAVEVGRAKARVDGVAREPPRPRVIGCAWLLTRFPRLAVLLAVPTSIAVALARDWPPWVGGVQDHPELS